jgi:flagellar assembly protein FliH
LSSQAPPEQSEARPFNWQPFNGKGPARPAKEGVSAFQPLQFERPKVDRDASPDRKGFMPLFGADKQEDPREVAAREARRMTSEANRMVEEAQGQVENLRTQAHDQGYQNGYEKGLQEGREASGAVINVTLDNFNRVVEALEQARARVLGNLEQELVAMVAAATDLVLMTPGAVRPELIIGVVRGAVAKVSQAERLTVHLNADDLALAEEFRPELVKGLGQLQHLELIADAELGRGDCLVETPQGQVDASLDTRRRQLWQVLEDTLHQGEPLDLEPLTQSAPPEPAQETAPVDQGEAPPAGGEENSEQWEDSSPSPVENEEEDW